MSRHAYILSLVALSACGAEAPTATESGSDPAPSAITLSASSVNLASLGATETLSATVMDQFGATMTGQSVRWTSNSPTVASVSTDGLITAISNGTSTVSASLGSISATANVTVAQVAATITISPDSALLESLGDTLTLIARVDDADGTGIINPTLSWTSSDPGVASIDPDGLLTSIQNGATTITATSDGIPTAIQAIVAQRPATVALKVQPALTQVGQTISQGMTVWLVDALGSVVSDATTDVTVTLGSNACGAVLGGTLTRQASSGVATFPDLTIDAAGWGYTLSFSADGMTDGVGVPFGVWEQGFWASGNWVSTGSMAFARRDLTMNVLPDGRVLVVGGAADSEIFDPLTGVFSIGPATVEGRSSGYSVTALPNGSLLFLGGNSSKRTSEIYNPTSATFSAHTPTEVDRVYHAATVLSDGRVLFAGGQSEGPQTHALASIYDPSTGGITATDSLTDDRSNPGSILLPDGRVLIFGGNQTTTPGSGVLLTTAEYYDPATGQFSAGPAMSGSPQHAIYLDNGTALAWDNWFESSETEIYDPSSGMFSSGPPLTQRHGSGTGTKLPDGSVLITGGSVATGPIVTAGVDLYDPVSATFSSIAPMLSTRQQHAAELLQDGRVLVIGGFGGAANLRTAELLTPSTCYVP
jgi:uncharacterized protein YjdB